MSQEDVVGEDENVVLGAEDALAADPLPDARDPSREREVAAQRESVMSQVRKRMSSAQFRPDPVDDSFHEEDFKQQVDSTTAGAASSAGGSGPDPAGESVPRTRHRAPSLAAQIAVPASASAAAPLVPASNNNNNSKRQFQDPNESSAAPAEAKNPAAAAGGGAGAAVEQQQEQKKQLQQKKDQTNDDAAAAAEEVEEDESGAASTELTQEQQQEQWRLRRKHFFIFTDAGKPVFTRWGDEGDFTELFGILQVLMEMSVSNGLGALKHVCLGSHDCHFFSDEHLRFVMVSATGEPPDTCQHQLRLICHCLLSGCPTVNKVLERNSSYDIRTQLLHPSVFRSLIKSMNHDVPFIFQGIDCGFFDQAVRNTLNETLRKDGFAGYDAGDEDGGGHLMSLIVCRGKILAWGQIPNFQLSTDDLLLLIHFSERCCGSGSSMENTWAPLCLPDYDKEGSFWVHVMQLGANKDSASASAAAAAAATQQQQQPQQQGVNTNTSSVSTSPLLIQLATHTEAISALKLSAQRVKTALAPHVDRLARASAKVMSLPPEWAQLGVMHVLFNRWGVLAYTAPPFHAQERKHRKQFLRTLLQVRSEALSLSKTSRPFLMRASPLETCVFSRKVVRLKSAAMGKASAELFLTFLPGTDAATISAAVNRVWDTMLEKSAWAQFVAPRQNFNI